LKVSAGILLIFIGTGHIFAGIWFGHEALNEISSAGLVNSVNPQLPVRMAIFWFLFSGFIAILLGESHPMDRAARLCARPHRLGFARLGDHRLPHDAGVRFLVTSSAGLADSASDSWLVRRLIDGKKGAGVFPLHNIVSFAVKTCQVPVRIYDSMRVLI